MDDKKSSRLQSLKLPRDLSLGLAKPKKQYTPNLNVVRNKDKPKEFLKKIDQKRREKTVHRDKQNHDSRYLQSSGVFSQGAGEVKRQSSHLEPRVSLRDNSKSTVSNMVLPTINRNNWNVNKTAEDAVLDELANCDMDSDDEKMSFAPLSLSTDGVKKVKKEIVKKESGEFESYLPEPFNSEIYNEENPALALVKLPDSFAGKGLSDDPNVKKLFDYPLSGMLEGQIGKLVIKKSGKMEVHIGRIKYELSPENTYEAKEELATITQSPNGDNYIAMLGNVHNNFIMFPDYDSLVKKKI